MASRSFCSASCFKKTVRENRRPSTSSERGGIFFRLIFLMFLAFFCLVIYVVRHPLLRAAGNFWVVDDPPAASDAIIVLGDDNYSGDRAARAAELYKANWAPVVVASGRLMRPYASVADLLDHDLRDRGVPEKDIARLTGRYRDTKEEAQAISQLIRERGWKKVILVTSNYHTRRAHYISERMYPPGTVLRMSAAPDADYNPNNWWETRDGEKIFFLETVSLFRAMWELRGYPAVTSEPGGLFSAAKRLFSRFEFDFTSISLFVYSAVPWFSNQELS